MDAKTARALIATLKNAAQSGTDSAPPAAWRVQRDHFIDQLDPTGEHGDFGNKDIRALVQFLGETKASATSRANELEWNTEVDAAVQRLLSGLR